MVAALGDAVARRTDPGIETDGGGIFVGVPALLELTESVPAQAEGIDQICIEDVNFADREVVCHRGRHAKPGAQLRAAARARSTARKLVFTLAVEIARG